VCGQQGWQWGTVWHSGTLAWLQTMAVASVKADLGGQHDDAERDDRGAEGAEWGGVQGGAPPETHF